MSTAWDDAAEEASHDQDDADRITPPPVPDTTAMLYGIIGEIAITGSAGREVHPVAIAAACLSWLSAEIGPDIHLPIGDTRHHVNLYTLHIGRSARGGKGDALGLVNRIRRAIARDRLDHPLGQVHTGGLSSREGLAGAVHDGYTIGKEEVPAVDDKRLWIIEAEFANVLAQGKRDGNTLLPALRDVWDGGSIQPLTKGRGMWSTRPHIALHGNITPGELQARIEAREVSGGTFNRILMIWAERTKLVALPEPTDNAMVAHLAGCIEDSLAWAKGTYPTTRDSRMASLTPAAAQLYRELYPSLKRPHEAGDLVAAATERRAPICLRIALIHAVMEKSLMITPEHIRVGYAWAQYGGATAAYVLGGMGGQFRDTAKETKLLAFLDNQPGKAADRRTITRDCFKGRVSGADLDRLLIPLVDDGAITRHEEPPKAGGRNRVIYSLATANNANNANNEQIRGLEPCEQRANNANNGGEQSQSSQSSRKVRTPESPAVIDCSQSSQSSHTSIGETDLVDGEI